MMLICINLCMQKHTQTPSAYVRPTWLHAGKKATDAHASLFSAGQKTITPIELDGQNYSVSRGYYVPFYGIDATTPNTKRTAILEQKRRFFYYAEKGIDVANSHEDIMNDYTKWEESKDARVKPTLGRLVVGSMLNRAARIEQALLMERAGGLSLEDSVGNSSDLKEEDKIKLKSELKQYSTILITNQELISTVRREDYSRDHDGLLADIIRETFKAYAAPNDRVVRGTIDKIGEAMVAIDETANITRNVIHLLQKHANLKKFMSEHGPTLQMFFDKLVDTSRARSGIKSSDIHYSDIYTDFSTATEDTFNLIRDLRAEARKYEGRGGRTLLQGLKLVSDGAKLIEDMAQSRYPYNALAFPDITPDKRPATSIDRFAAEAKRLAEHKPSRNIG